MDTHLLAISKRLWISRDSRLSLENSFTSVEHWKLKGFVDLSLGLRAEWWMSTLGAGHGMLCAAQQGVRDRMRVSNLGQSEQLFKSKARLAIQGPVKE
eukprot:3961835-Amphidinium_carterae.1